MSPETSAGMTAAVPPTPTQDRPMREARIMMELSDGDHIGLVGSWRLFTCRLLVAPAAALAAIAMCCVLASLVAASDGAVEEDASVDAANVGVAGRIGLDPPGDVRRTSAEQGHPGDAERQSVTETCHTAQIGEPCYRHVMLAMKEVAEQKDSERFPRLTAASTFEEFQAAMINDPWASCQRPCGIDSLGGTEKALAEKPAADKDPVVSAQSWGWRPSGRVVSQGQWCSANEPEPDWGVRGCGNGNPLQVKILTYNLFWWNLFGRRGGNGGSAGHLIAEAGRQQPFDFMAFQECEGIGWVLGDAGLASDFVGITGPHALCIAYRRSAWNKLADSFSDVAEDRADQWYGTRAAMWVRLQHWQTGQTVLFINHHGPLPLHSGGRCGGEATAYNLLKLMGTQAQGSDVVVLVGDFNAGPWSDTVRALRNRMHLTYTGFSFGGVDHVLSSCPAITGRNLGSGGSDHDALEAVLRL